MKQTVLKYSLVGALGTLIDFFFLILLVEIFQVGVIPASIVSFIFATINNFIGNKTWTFKNKSKRYFRQYLHFLSVASIGLLFNVAVMFLLYSVLGIWYVLSKALASLIVVIWNIFGNVKWVFKEKFETPPHLTHAHKYSIIIPAYNEEKRILPTLEKISNFFTENKISHELIVVNDGSSDSTQTALSNLEKINLINLDKNYGKGYAIRQGIKKSQGEYVLIMDSDMATPIEEIYKFQHELLKNPTLDAVIGVRKHKDQYSADRPLRRKIITLASKTVIRTLIKDISDTQCGFKLIRGSTAKKISDKLRINRYGFDIEMIALLQSGNHSIQEVEVEWEHKDHSKVNPIKDSIKTFSEIMNIHYNFWLNKYN